MSSKEALKDLPAVLIFFLGFLAIRVCYGLIPALILKYAAGLNWTWSIAIAFILSFYLESLKFKWDDRRDEIYNRKLQAKQQAETTDSQSLKDMDQEKVAQEIQEQMDQDQSA